jgi:sulfopyruvate decarboxylase subunit alpha
MNPSPTDALYSTLRVAGLDFFLSVPCKLLAGLIDKLQADSEIIYSPVTREEEGVGIACGAHLAGRRPAIVMQNSGFGNCSNAILSLLNYYRVPVVFVVSHRGSDGEPIEAQRMMGNAIKGLLNVIDVDQVSVTEPSMLHVVKPAIEAARAANRSLAVLLPFSFWAGEK